MDGISGKRALVTGGSTGIGLCVAKCLVEQGATVFIAARDQQKLDNAVEESGNKLIPIQLDVTDANAVQKAIGEILPIQLLFNNAGISLPTPILESTSEDFDITMNTNLKSAIQITQIVTKDLIARGLEGNVVNMSSLSGEKVNPGRFLYCVSKAGLNIATKCFAVELGSKNIRVNAVSASVASVGFGLRPQWQDPESPLRKMLFSRTPPGRLVEGNEIANLTVFLLSNQSSMINGQCIAIDGGFSAT